MLALFNAASFEVSNAQRRGEVASPKAECYVTNSKLREGSAKWNREIRAKFHRQSSPLSFYRVARTIVRQASPTFQPEGKHVESPAMEIILEKTPRSSRRIS